MSSEPRFSVKTLYDQYRESTDVTTIACGVYVRSKSFDAWLVERLNAADRQLARKKARRSNQEFPDGADLIAQERQRQISTEGWSPTHDDRHDQGELALAAIKYASPLAVEVGYYVHHSCGCRSVGECPHTVLSDKKEWSDPWPWHRSSFKPSDRIRDLVKAGALIAAEIDRLQRATVKAHQESALLSLDHSDLDPEEAASTHGA
jgi:hypothetical protein